MLKEKRCETLKARVYADRRKQRKYITKEEVDSSTIQTISLMISLIIDVEEARNVATADVVVSMKNYIYESFDIFALWVQQQSTFCKTAKYFVFLKSIL